MSGTPRVYTPNANAINLVFVRNNVIWVTGAHAMGLKEGQWYPDHLGEWIRLVREHDNMLLVEFESLKRVEKNRNTYILSGLFTFANAVLPQDFKSEARRIAKFLDVELTEEDVTTVCERCTIDSMKSKMDQVNDGSEFRFMQKNIRKGAIADIH